MFERGKLDSLESYFKRSSERGHKTVYFCRLASWNQQTGEFLARFRAEVNKNGVYIKSKIPNPDERQLAFFDEMAGLDFRMDMEFMKSSLKSWLPRLTDGQRTGLAEAMFEILSELQRAGKNQAMLRNAYIKFMCWFYYKFERILNRTGMDEVPKILYEGDISAYELKLMRILSGTGCDVLLVEKNGDGEYTKQDPSSAYSQKIDLADGGAFPPENTAGPAPTPLQRREPVRVNINIHTGAAESTARSQNTTVGTGAAGTSSAPLRIKVGPREENKEEKTDRTDRTQGVRASDFTSLYPPPAGMMGTNSWLTGDPWQDSLKKEAARGDKKDVYYNMFVSIYGAEEKGTYLSRLLRWKMKLEANGRRLILIEKQILMPSVEEVQKVRRGNYPNVKAMIADILSNVSFPSCRELEKLVKKAFVELIAEEAGNVQKVMNRAVCMIVWLRRYIPQMFPDWRLHEYPVFLYYGTCRNENEALFLRLLSRIPADVFLICPDLELAERTENKLHDQVLFSKAFEESLPMGSFPDKLEEVTFHTAAYNAERDLDTAMYQDSGIYRNHQFKQAIPVILQTTYEEIGILWKQEAKYRPNFEVLADRVMVPVIFSKISGVKDGNKVRYWQDAARFTEDGAFLIDHLPYITAETPNPIKPHVTSFLKNGKLLTEKIIHHPSYQYGFIREDMQRFIFDKIQQMLDSKIITGTFSRGVEYTILATALNMDKSLLRILQKYDFTKNIPKMVLINTNEGLCSLEDSILTMLLSLLGFDVLLLIPTGYQSVERFFSSPVFTEHQVGEYIYDMSVPNLNDLATAGHVEGIISKLWSRRK
ncbi:YceG family protein [Clostridium sp. AM58-1XD]|uniref:YceG family protein n=1 Tax=Clostridium sp. AM58-1XD TaxID=2292307 RepID=UPI0015F614AD|nr:YceG family protein [Clostridium sp. AM58-1XD]